MAPLDRQLFKGSAAIARQDLRRLEIRNLSGDIDETLVEFGWNGKPAGCIMLKLSADNASVTAGQFLARGRLTRQEVKLEAAKLWATVEAGLIITLQIPEAGMFTFGDGGLCSDYLDSDMIDHCITTGGRNGQPVLQAEYENRGVKNFCIRMVCHLAKASARAGVTLGYAVLAFPGTAEDVCEVSDLTRSPGWPGIVLCEGEMALLPYPGASWCCPVLPMLLTGTPWEEEEETHPPFEEIAEKVSWIMTTSEPADGCKARKAMADKWQKYCDDPDSFNPKQSPLAWPQPAQTAHAGREI
jgi:hypothetical protein